MKIKLKNTLYFCWDTLTILSKILKSNEVQRNIIRYKLISEILQVSYRYYARNNRAFIKHIWLK